MQLLNLILTLAEENRYLILFFVYLVEGPIAGFVSAMIASVGELNIFIVSILLILAEVGADLFYYFFGKTLSESKLQESISKYEEKEYFKNIKDLLTKKSVKALAFVKIIGFIAVPTIIIIGNYQILKPKRFFLWTTIICLIKDLLILLSGYFLGISTEIFLAGYNIYRIVGIVLTLIILLYIFLQINKEKVGEFTLKILKKV